MGGQPDPMELFADWLKGQQSMFESGQQGLAEFAKSMSDGASQMMGGVPSMPDWSSMGQRMDPDYGSQMFRMADQHHKAWLKFADQWQPQDSQGPALDGLKHMLDPSSWLNTGVEEVNATLHKMAQAPEFADSWDSQLKMMQSTAEWADLREKATHYGRIVGMAWMQAYQEFITELTHEYQSRQSFEFGPKDYEAGLDLWLKIANKHLLKTQRSDDFLKAQKDVLRASVAFKNRERAMVEVFCETYSIPTRTEVDDMQQMLHQLRREVRGLKREVEALKKGTKPKTTRATRKTQKSQKAAPKGAGELSAKSKNLPANPYAS